MKDKQPSLDEDEVEAALEKARAEDPLYQQILADGSSDDAAKSALAQGDDRVLAHELVAQ